MSNNAQQLHDDERLHDDEYVYEQEFQHAEEEIKAFPNIDIKDATVEQLLNMASNKMYLRWKSQPTKRGQLLAYLSKDVSMVVALRAQIERANEQAAKALTEPAVSSSRC